MKTISKPGLFIASILIFCSFSPGEIPAPPINSIGNYSLVGTEENIMLYSFYMSDDAKMDILGSGYDYTYYKKSDDAELLSAKDIMSHYGKEIMRMDGGKKLYEKIGAADDIFATFSYKKDKKNIWVYLWIQNVTDIESYKTERYSITFLEN